MSRESLRTRAKVIAVLAAGAVLLPIAGLELVARLTPRPSLARMHDTSPTVLDRDGHLLRAYLSHDDRWRLKMSVDEAPSDYLRMLIAYEDQRFWHHHGIDPWALLRAGAQMLQHGRVISGGSTLTMQAARLLGPQSRGVAGKIKQLIVARQLELSATKREILEIYLTLAPYGGNIEGLRAAALSYFGKEPRKITTAEAALLVALPQSPERRRPDRDANATLRAVERVLQRPGIRMALSAKSLSRSRLSQLDRRPQRGAMGLTFAGAHVADLLHRDAGGAQVITSLIDGRIQRLAERVATGALQGWPDEVNVAAVIVRNSDCSVVGYVGGADYRSEARSGQVDLVQAIRSPGSTLKPFIYGMGFESRVVLPNTIITDAPIGIHDYEPRNFSGDYQGDMTVRSALIQSINTGAVAVLRKVKPQRLAARLRSAGVPLAMDGTDMEAGLAIGLGGTGVKLFDLVRGYVGLANRGATCALRLRPMDAAGPPLRLLESDAAWAVTDILADMPPPAGFVRLAAADGGRRLAYKTGTSYGFRDAWAVGYDPLHTVGVWVGRPNGTPHLNAYGLSTAAPVLFRMFDALPVPAHDVAGEAPNSVLANRNAEPARLQRFDARPLAPDNDLAITFPRANETVMAQTSTTNGPNGAAAPFAPLPWAIKGGTPPYSWFIDGAQAGADPSPRFWWTPKGRGAVTLAVSDAAGRRAEVKVWVETPAIPPPDPRGAVRVSAKPEVK